jgi:phosphomannomutase
VSSPVLGRIAEHFGLSHSETLTGFKYVSRVPDLIFGFEEAIGYLVTPSLVRDKDGISAALAVLDLHYSLAGRGETLEDYLALIEAQVGAFASGQVTIRLDGSAPKTPLTHALRSAVPSMIGSRGVSQCDDFLKGVGSFPKDDILRFFLSDDSRVIVRPSGTEPKIKLYIDTQAATRAEAEGRLSEIEADLRELVRALP